MGHLLKNKKRRVMQNPKDMKGKFVSFTVELKDTVKQQVIHNHLHNLYKSFFPHKFGILIENKLNSFLCKSAILMRNCKSMATEQAF